MNTVRTVLLAEDSLTQALRIRYYLENAGFEVLAARDGKEALDMLRQSPPDLVLTDLNMPEMDGLELVVHAQAEFPAVPVVLATTSGSESLAAEALRKGALSYVPKQFLNAIDSTLHRVLAVMQADTNGDPSNHGGTSGELRLRLTADDGQVASVVGQWKRFIHRFGLRDSCGTLRAAVALDEALQRAIVDGNLEVSPEMHDSDDIQALQDLITERRQQPPYSGRSVDVRVRVNDQTATCQIHTDAAGPGAAISGDPTDPAKLEQLSARSAWLMHAFADEIRQNEQGTETTVIIHRTSE